MFRPRGRKLSGVICMDREGASVLGAYLLAFRRMGFVAQIGLRSYFPLNRTDLAYGLCLGDAKRCEAV
jgi:hypothetical protein